MNLTRDQLIEKICDMNDWHKIHNGERKGMWRYSGPIGTILLADKSSPPHHLNAVEFLKRLNLWPTDP